MLTDIERKVRTEKNQNESFAKFMDNPMTRMTISTIPAGSNNEALPMLLRAAFDAGCESGAGNTAGEFLNVILTGMMKDKNSPGGGTGG